jgi:SH3-like domain-containing protein
MMMRVGSWKICGGLLKFLCFAFFQFYFTAEARHFVSLKTAQVNLRIGPGKEYPIVWVFMAQSVPMMLMVEFGQWRKVRFLDNSEGWVHQNLISKKNTAIVIKNHTMLYRYSSKSVPIAKLEKNVIINVLKKQDDLVKIEINGIKGWLERKDVWGVNEESVSN